LKLLKQIITRSAGTSADQPNQQEFTTGRQPKPDESDACRREGNVREYNAVRYRAERRAARRAKLAGRGRRCFAQEPWVPVIGRLSRVFEVAALPRYRNLRIAGGSHAGTAASARHGTRRARQWNLDRPRTVDPAHPMRPLAGMLNQRTREIFWRRVTSAIKRAATGSLASARRELLRNDAGWRRRINLRARLQSGREIYRRNGPPHP